MPIETVDYIDVRNAAAQLAGLDPANLDDQEANTFKVHISNRFKTIYEQRQWPEFNRLEERWFRDEWLTGSTYALGDQVYYTPSKKYYQSLQASNSGNAPATGDPLVENSAFWAELKVSYPSTIWDSATSYAIGEQVLYQPTALEYQAIVATTPGDLPTDDTKFGPLVEFDRYIPWSQTGKTDLGQVQAMWDANRRINKDSAEISFEESENGAQSLETVTTSVWIDYRIRFKRLNGADYDSTSTYVSGDQVYFSDSTTPGNFYNANQTVAVSESPSSAATKWDKIIIPVRFEQYLIYGSYADWLDTEGQAEKAKGAESMATKAKEHQFMVLSGQQQQRRKLKVLVR